MKYSRIVKGTFIDRPNRFIAHVEIDGQTETVHVKNTGRCKELLLPGVTVILEDFRSPEFAHRKTKFDLVAVYKINPAATEDVASTGTPAPGVNVPDSVDLAATDNKYPFLINMDSQAPNKVVHEWLKTQDFSFIKPEYTYGQSRIDFYCQRSLTNGRSEEYLIEVKGCTLEKQGIGYFPDAPTERGVKHLNELAAAAKSGYKCAVAFAIQMEGIKEVRPNIETHPQFGEALEQAKKAGVEVWFLCCSVKEDELKVVEWIKG